MQLMSFVLVVKDGRYLLIQEASKSKGKWFFPGGQVARTEDPETAVLRETREEAGCTVVLDYIFLLHHHPAGLKKGKLTIFYSGHTSDTALKNSADKHSLDAQWFTYEEILTLPLRDNALEIIDTYRNSKMHLPRHQFWLDRVGIHALNAIS
jgi:8-oxo-dGTP pyrophosphatase MutT (NUDIX family)